MARMTKKLVREIWNSTQRCWEKAVWSFYKQNPDKAPPSLPKRMGDMGGIFDSREIASEDKEAIDQQYRTNLLNLTTPELELVIEAYRKKNSMGRSYISRAAVTIDAILTELLERQIKQQK